MKRDKKNRVPASFFIALAESAKAINNYAALGPQSQQMLLAQFTRAKDDEQRKIIEELKK